MGAEIVDQEQPNDAFVSARISKPRVAFESAIDSFVSHVDAIGSSMISLVYALQHVGKQTRDKLDAFETEHCKITIEPEGRKVAIPNARFRDWKSQQRLNHNFVVARKLLPRSLMVTLVSTYDAFLGDLLRAIYTKHPGLLQASERKISFEQLSRFSSLEQAKEYILEKEIENTLRASHAEQFSFLEKLMDMALRKNLEVWPIFIELTERRNLFVHTDGVVSSQYLSVCRDHKCTLDENAKEGAMLWVSKEYFIQAFECVFEIGMKLGHVMWRKQAPEEREQADAHMQRVTYDLLERGSFKLAARLLDFACEMKKFHSEADKLVMTVNRALAYKGMGKGDRCTAIMKAVDWSAKGDNFRLADAVLAERWEQAASLMRKIGKDASPAQYDYRDWPLFKDFRVRPEFLKQYAEIFGTQYSDAEGPANALADSPSEPSAAATGEAVLGGSLATPLESMGPEAPVGDHPETSVAHAAPPLH